MFKQQLAMFLPPKRFTGPQQLWAAVLDNAVLSLEQRGYYIYGNGNRDHQKRTQQHESLTWLKSDNTAPGSFLFICDTLCIDPDFLRARLLKKHTVAPETAETGRRLRRYRAILS